MHTNTTKAILEAIASLHKSGGNTVKRPVLDNFKLTDSTIEYTNLSCGLTVNLGETIPAIVNPVLVPISSTLNWLKKTKSEQFYFSTGEHTINLHGSKSKLKLPSYSAYESPEMPVVEGDTVHFTISGKKLQEGLDRTSFAVHKDVNRHSLDCMLVEGKEGDVRLLATDQITLRCTNLNIFPVDDFKVNFTQDVIRLLKVLHKNDKTIEWRIGSMGDTLIMKSKTYTIVARQNDVQFPNYYQCLLDHAHKPGELNTKEQWIETLGELSTVSCENARNVAIHDGELRACTPLGSITVGFNTGTVEAPCGVNPYFVEQYIKTLSKKEETRLILSGPKKVLCFSDDYGMYFLSPVVV